MNAEKAFKDLIIKFPFNGYINTNSLNGIYKTVANVAIKNLKPGDSILDFGSGPCDKTGLLKLMGFNCTACDDLQDEWHTEENNREKILNFANSLDIQFYQLHGNELHFENESFDMVILNDVIEHLHNRPRSLLESLIEKLKYNGILFITVPNAGNIRKRINLLIGKTNMPPFSEYYWHQGPWRGHNREYVYDDLKKLAKFLNLKDVNIQGENHMLERIPKVIRPIYLFITSIIPGWRDSWSLIAKK